MDVKKYVFLLGVIVLPQVVYSYEFTGSKWSVPGVYFHTNLIDSFGRTNSPSGESWSVAFERAMQEWSDKTNFTLFAVSENMLDTCPIDNRNGVDFATDLCGFNFGSQTLAVTLSLTSGGNYTETDIIFNDNQNWDIYTGNLRFNAVDFYRVALHELGHALGLDHEDDTSSIMTSIVGNIDELQTDDINGVNILYPAAEKPLKIHIGNSVILPDEGFDFELDSDRNNLFVSIPSRGEVVVVSTITRTITNTIVTGAEPHGLGLSLDKTKLYVALLGQGKVAVIDTTTFDILETIDVLAVTGNTLTYDVIEGKQNRVFVSARPVNSGTLSHIGMIKTDESNAVSRVASDVSISWLPMFERGIGEIIYIQVGLRGTYLYKMDISTDVAPIVFDDSSGSTSAKRGASVSVHPDGTKLAIGGDILSTDTFDIISSITPGFNEFSIVPKYSDDGLSLYHISGKSLPVSNFAAVKVYDSTSMVKQDEYALDCRVDSIELESGTVSKIIFTSSDTGLLMGFTGNRRSRNAGPSSPERPILCFFSLTENVMPADNQYFRLSSGSYWKYIENNGLVFSNTVLDEIFDISNKQTKAIIDSDNLVEFFEIVDGTVNLVRGIVEGSTIELFPSMKIISDAPLIGEGLVSNGTAAFFVPNSGLHNLNYGATSVVEAVESINTSLGNLNAIRVLLTMNINGSISGFPINNTSTQRYWFVEDLGYVKKEENSNGIITQHEILTAVVDRDGDNVNDYRDNCPAIVNPQQTDTDNDGIGNDCDADDDNDGVLDDRDVFPLDKTESVDTDNDGIGDNYEVANGLNIFVNDAGLDKDSDTLTNLQEFQLGSDANNMDTDGDGINDGDEITLGRNPLVREGAMINIINNVLIDD